MWYKNSEKNKVLILLRGVSGSGKSTLANQIVGDGQIFSTDDYWIQDGEYKFNSEQLGAAHKWNQNRAIIAMEQGVSPIIIDNTIVSAWEAKE